MKLIIARTSSRRWLVAAVAFVGVPMLATAPSFGDRGRGSIRAEGRSAPARSAPPRAEPSRAEAPRPEPSRPEPARPEPVRAEPQPQRRDGRPEGRDNREQPPARPEPRDEQRRGEQPRDEQRRGEQPRDEQRRGEAPRGDVRPDWDAGDEEARHFGGFDHGAPEHGYRGERVRVLPDRHFDVFWNNQHYFWDYGDGFYLAQPDGEYVVVAPPIGAVVPALPYGAVQIPFGPTDYYYLDGTFYVQQGNGFVVVSPPPGIIVPSLPAGAVQVIFNGAVIYQFGGFNYNPTLQAGVTAYVVTPG